MAAVPRGDKRRAIGPAWLRVHGPDRAATPRGGHFRRELGREASPQLRRYAGKPFRRLGPAAERKRNAAGLGALLAGPAAAL